VFVTGAGAAIIGVGAGHAELLAVTGLVLIGHIAMAVVNPTTRPALRGMILGAVHRTWAQRHHPAWLDEMDVAEKPDAR
jgi:cytochrome b subunit of formate dehydrogenase